MSFDYDFSDWTPPAHSVCGEEVQLGNPQLKDEGEHKDDNTITKGNGKYNRDSSEQPGFDLPDLPNENLRQDLSDLVDIAIVPDMFDEQEEPSKLEAMESEEEARNNQPTVSEIRSNAKKSSDDKIFEVRRELVHAQLSEQKSDVPKLTIGEEGKAFIEYLTQKVEETFTEEEDQHIRKGLLDVLNKSFGMEYSVVWWMIVICMLTGDRGKYNTPKENEGKVKDPKRVESSLKREFGKWKKRLDVWIPMNLLCSGMINKDEEKMFMVEAYQAIEKNTDMLVKKNGANAEEKLCWVLKESTGRSYEEKCWMTIASFRIMKGSRGSYNKRKADNK